jgi:hypothetical protein
MAKVGDWRRQRHRCHRQGRPFGRASASLRRVLAWPGGRLSYAINVRRGLIMLKLESWDLAYVEDRNRLVLTPDPTSARVRSRVV